MTMHQRYRHPWTFCVAALGLWLSYGWPVMTQYWVGGTIRDVEVSPLWFVPFTVMGIALSVAMVLNVRAGVHWALLGIQAAAVVAMTAILPWAGMSSFLVVIAFQVGMATTPAKALSWVAAQNLLVVGTLAQALNPDICWVLTKSGALQLLFVFTAQALRREAAATRALAQTNRELRSAQAIIANSVRDAERTRISRELHDAWGHELTALRLQLEIASQVSEPAKVNDHVMKAKGLSSALLTKVRDVVATLREAERGDLRKALQGLADSVPTPVVHVAVAKDITVNPDQWHALIRCSQEAITNAVKHSNAANLWLEVVTDSDGVRLVARNDGDARPATALPGSGLRGMRERIEALGGSLTVGAGKDFGFIIDAWLPTAAPRPA